PAVLAPGARVVVEDGLTTGTPFVVRDKAWHVEAGHAADDGDDLLRASDVHALFEERPVEAKVSRLEERLALERDALGRFQGGEAPLRVIRASPHAVHHGSVGGEVPTATPGLLPVRAGEDRRRIGGGAQGEGAPTQDERVAELGTELPEAHGRRVAPGSEIIRVL